MIGFHEVMRSVRAKLVYSEDRLLIGLKNPRLRDLISIGDVLVESLGISLDEMSVVIHDSHIALIAPFGAKREVIEGVADAEMAGVIGEQGKVEENEAGGAGKRRRERETGKRRNGRRKGRGEEGREGEG